MANEMNIRVSRSVQIGGVTVGGTVQTLTADHAAVFQKTIPASTTNGEIDIVVDVSALVALTIEASKACKVYTNDLSSGSPDDTIELTANVPLIWTTGDPDAAKFLTKDVTKMYVTCTDATLLKFGAAIDSTPVLGDT